MKPNNKLRLLATCCVALAFSPMVISAQTTPARTTTTTTDDRQDRDHDYGWIGLLGLLGLGGLMRKKDDRYDTTAGRTDVRR
ncbi:MAG: WGxxGxxG-CTERM domain-containing protein [Verrucomicrobiota bacterium]|nr:WGxxGxxG-CTERM domain-containing protein [Verrucomicrobiota bacterium]